jgi:hypothetical protein
VSKNEGRNVSNIVMKREMVDIKVRYVKKLKDEMERL